MFQTTNQNTVADILQLATVPLLVQVSSTVRNGKPRVNADQIQNGRLPWIFRVNLPQGKMGCSTLSPQQ